MSLAAVKSEFSGEYVWSFPGAPIRIRTPIRLIEQLRQCLTSAGTRERGGILLGKSVGGRVEISGFELFDRQTSDPHFNLSASEMLDLGSQIGLRPREVVGYFRIDVRGRVRLTDEDLNVINKLFRDKTHVFLVLSTDERSEQIGGFFFWDGETLFSELSFKEFSLDSRRLTTIPSPHVDSASLSSVSAASPPPAAAREQPRLMRRPWIRPAALVATVATLSFAAMKLPFRSGLPPADPPQATASTPAAVFGPALLVSAQQVGNSVAITWDSASPALADARMAVVTVRDGNSKQEFALTREQFKLNKLVYFPESRQLEVTVETFLKSGEMVREAVIVAIGENSVRSRSVTPSAQASAPPVTAVGETAAAESTPPVRRLDVETLRSRVAAQERTIDYVLPPEAPPVAPSTVNVKAPEFLPGAAVSTSLPRPPAPARSELVIEAARPLRRVQPAVPANILGMLKKTVSVHVRITVDAAGKVTAAEPVSPAPGISQYLATNAAATARLWTFTPARRGNTPIPSELILKFDFAHR